MSHACVCVCVRDRRGRCPNGGIRNPTQAGERHTALKSQMKMLARRPRACGGSEAQPRATGAQWRRVVRARSSVLVASSWRFSLLSFSTSL